MASHHKGPSLEHLRQMFTEAEKEWRKCEGVDECASRLKHKSIIEEAFKKKERHENYIKEQREREKIRAKQPDDKRDQYRHEQPGRIAELNKQSKENYAKENPVLSFLEGIVTNPIKTINEGITVFGNLANDAKYAIERGVNDIKYDITHIGSGVSRRNRRQKRRISKKRNLRRK
jgi:hypothetical protein